MGDQTTDNKLAALARRRWRVALLLTSVMLFTYFGFILSVAYAKERLGQLLLPGLSLGIALGASVILVAFALTGIYVRWANRVYDTELEVLREEARVSAKDETS